MDGKVEGALFGTETALMHDIYLCMYVHISHDICSVMYVFLIPCDHAFGTLIGDCALYSHALIGGYVHMILPLALSQGARLMIMRHLKQSCIKRKMSTAILWF